MKYCELAYEYLYIDSFEGEVYLCPWMEQKTGMIGNILEEDLEVLWNNEIANKLRDSHTDNSFCYCRPQACPHIQNDDFPRIEDENKYRELTKTRKYPTQINLAYDYLCNQSCETCRPEVWTPPHNYKEKIRTIHNRIKPYLETARFINTTGHGDPFASPYTMELLEEMNPKNPDIIIQLETNGVFADEAHWKRIEHLSKFDLRVIVTVNSYDKFTYEHISRGGNYEKLQENLAYMSKLRKEGFLNNFTVALVTQDRNFREIPSFIEHTFSNFAVDRILLRPVYQWGTMPEKTFWFKDVLNPKHPYHAEYLEILQHPALKDKRVYNFGGEMDHPARDFYIEEPVVTQCCCCEEPKVKPLRKIFAHIVSSFIPCHRLRRKIRDRIKYGKKDN